MTDSPRDNCRVCQDDDKLAAVRRLHAERVAPIDGYPADHHYCVEDRQSWPCATIRALGEA